MQIEKKLILCSILAVVIGIATIAPLQFLMNTDTVAAVPNVEPWFNVDVTYANCNLYNTGGNGTTTWDGASMQVVANFSLNPDTPKDADAQIEYYKFAVSSDQGYITDLGYFIVEDKASIVSGLNGDGTVTFENGLTYSGPASNGGGSMNWAGNKPDSRYGAAGTFIAAYNGEDLPQAAVQLRNAQTLSIDVSKVCTVTVKGTITVTTPADPTVIQHIELTKTDSGFVYGTYTEGPLPFPIQTPGTSSGNQTLPDSVKIFTPDNSGHP